MIYGPQLKEPPKATKMGPELFGNYYVHHGEIWLYTWDSMCSSMCWKCRTEVEPYMSVDQAGNKLVHVGPDFVPEHGWSHGLTNLEGLINYALNELPAFERIPGRLGIRPSELPK